MFIGSGGLETGQSFWLIFLCGILGPLVYIAPAPSTIIAMPNAMAMRTRIPTLVLPEQTSVSALDLLKGAWVI